MNALQEDGLTGYTDTLFLFHGKYYVLNAKKTIEIKQDGTGVEWRVFKQRPYGVGTFRSNEVFWDVYLQDNFFLSDDADKYRNLPIEDHRLTDFDDPVTAMVFEYLALHYSTPDHGGEQGGQVMRIIVSGKENMAINNWEVVHND